MAGVVRVRQVNVLRFLVVRKTGINECKKKTRASTKCVVIEHCAVRKRHKFRTDAIKMGIMRESNVCDFIGRFK